MEPARSPRIHKFSKHPIPVIFDCNTALSRINHSGLSERHQYSIKENQYEYADVSFSLSGNGDIVDCYIDEKGELDHIEGSRYYNTITYPLQEPPVELEIVKSTDGNLHLPLYNTIAYPAVDFDADEVKAACSY